MEINIFTKDQQDFFQTNYETSLQLEHEQKKLEEIDDIRERKSKQEHIKDSLAIINENLAPFYARNRLYEERKNKIIRSHGFNKEDMYDEDTINAIVELENKMREEVSNLTPDLTMDRTNYDELGNMFKGDSEKENEKSNKSDLEKSFK